MKVLYAVSEAVPFCRTGGLGDIAGALPKALAAEEIKTAVIMPLYRSVWEKFSGELEFVVSDYTYLSWRRAYCGLFKMKKNGVLWYFIDNEQYFDRPELYGYADDGERFGFFSRAVAGMLAYLDFKPDVVHCNDWHTALIPVYLKLDSERDAWKRSIRTVLNIHNIDYQGIYGPDTLGDLFGLRRTSLDDGTMIMNGNVNLLKGGIVCADAVTADSETHAEELKHEYFAHGLESIMTRYAYKTSGVLNGLDTVRYDPDVDKLLYVNYNFNSVSKRAENKLRLQELMGLKRDKDIPLIGIISSFNTGKGFDLISDAFGDIMSLGVQIAVVGQGDKAYENFFAWAAEQYPGSVGYKHGTDDETAAAVYAGCDLFLMPSRSEPCGLNQMIAMRYGAVPVVRGVGGLKDSVQAYESLHNTGTGFVFNAYTSGDMFFVLHQAVDLYRGGREAFANMQKHCMQQDFSWKKSAKCYEEIYEALK